MATAQAVWFFNPGERQEIECPATNEELREMAQNALDNWDFNPETDPNGDVKAGLEYYANDGDVIEDKEIPALFSGYHFSLDKWDILEELAKGVKCQ